MRIISFNYLANWQEGKMRSPHKGGARIPPDDKKPDAQSDLESGAGAA